MKSVLRWNPCKNQCDTFNQYKPIMTNRKLIRLLRTKGYKRVTLETDNGEPKTFYTYRRGLHINATKNLSFHIVPHRKA